MRNYLFRTQYEGLYVFSIVQNLVNIIECVNLLCPAFFKVSMDKPTILKIRRESTYLPSISETMGALEIVIGFLSAVGGDDGMKIASYVKDTLNMDIEFCSREVFELFVDLDEERDKFGRILGDFCDNQGNRLSQALIDAHLAVPYDGQNKDEITQKHLENFVKVKKG